MNIARLPVELGEALSEVNDMLACPARNLQDDTRCGKPLTEHICNMLSIAKRGRSRPAKTQRRCFVKPLFVSHERPLSRDAREWRAKSATHF